MCESSCIKNKTPIGRETKTQWKIFCTAAAASSKNEPAKNTNRIANSLANPTETLHVHHPNRPDPTLPYPARRVPYVLRLRLRLALVMWGHGALGPSCLKLLFMIMGSRRFGSDRFVATTTTYLPAEKCVCAFGEAKNAKQQSNNKEKEQNENRKKQQKMVLYL